MAKTKTYSVLILLMCLTMGISFHCISQQWKISNYSDTITHLAKNLEYTRDILNKANDKISNYSDTITNLTKKLKYTEYRLNKADDKIFALGRNLAGNNHSRDITFTIITDNAEFEFFAHKYILIANSEYFEQLFSNNSIDNIVYYNVTKNEFNSFLELLYFGQFNTDVELENYENVVKYVNKYLIFEKYKNYIETYFSEKINDNMETDNMETDNMELIARVYNISSTYKLDSLQVKILAGIYYKWKCNSDGKYPSIINYPTILYDYINFINCGENNIKMLTD